MNLYIFYILSFVYVLITVIALRIVIFRTKSETPSLINWIQKPVVIILFTFFSTIINFIGYSYSQFEPNFWINLFQSITSAIKFTLGEFRINEVELLFETDFYYRILYTVYSISTFVFTLLIVVKLAFQNIYNTFMYVTSIYYKHRLFILGSLDEVKMFIKTLPENTKEKVIIILPINFNSKIEIYDVKNILNPSFNNKKIKYSIKFENISSDIFTRLNYKKNAFFFKREQYTKTIVLFENPTYQMRCYSSAKKFHDDNQNILGIHNFYIRNNFSKDTSYFNTDIDFNKGIFLFSEKETLNKIFSEKYMFNQHFKNFNLIDEKKEQSFVQYIFMGFNDRSKEILKHYMIRNSFPFEDNKTLKIKFKYDVFSNDVNDNADFFSTIYFRELFEEGENGALGKLKNIEDFLCGIDETLIPSYYRHPGDIFDNKFILKLEEIIRSYEGKSVHFYFVLGLSTDYNNFDATQIINDFFNRKYPNFNHNYSIFAHLKNTEVSYSENKNNTFFYGALKETLNYKNIINENEMYIIKRLNLAIEKELEKETKEFETNQIKKTYLKKNNKKIDSDTTKKQQKNEESKMERYNFMYIIKRLHLAFEKELEKETKEFETNHIKKTYLKKNNKKIDSDTTKKQQKNEESKMERYNFVSSRAAVLILKQRLNLIGFDLKENVLVKDPNFFDLYVSFKKFNQENNKVYEKFRSIYFNTDEEKVQEEKKENQNNEIYEYYKKRNDSVRRKLANIEHSRWVANQIIELGWIPMKEEVFKELFISKIKKIELSQDFDESIDTAKDRSRKMHLCITDYKNIHEIAKREIGYLKEENINDNNFMVRYDYYYKDFRLMDALMYLFPFIDEEENNEQHKYIKENSIFYIIEKKKI